jgi:hypothetical protein
MPVPNSPDSNGKASGGEVDDGQRKHKAKVGKKVL